MGKANNAERLNFEDFPEAFDYCREKGSPVTVLVKGELWKLFPSGRGDPIEKKAPAPVAGGSPAPKRIDVSTQEGIKAALSFLVDLGKKHCINGHSPLTMAELGAELSVGGFHGWRKGQERALLATYKMGGWAAAVAETGNPPKIKGW